MKQIRYLLLFIGSAILSACSSEPTNVVTGENASSERFANAVTGTVDASTSIGDPTTRALYTFNSENLSYVRNYEDGDMIYVPNKYYTNYVYRAYTFLQACGKLYYVLNGNTFTGTFWNDTYIEPEIWPGQIQPSDTIMEVIWDKNFTALSWQQEKDTCFVYSLENQNGSMQDCFSRQMPYTRTRRDHMFGTQVWTYLNAYYWVIFKCSSDIKNIKKVAIHADEPMASEVYYGYNGKLNSRTVYNGPYASGVVWNSNHTQADCFISFYTGGTATTFNNFGFDVTYELTDGTIITDSEDVRPQVKEASPSNVYRNMFSLSKEHGLQNMYIDEKIEVNNWEKVADVNADVQKTGKEIPGGGSGGETGSAG